MFIEVSWASINGHMNAHCGSHEKLKFVGCKSCSFLKLYFLLLNYFQYFPSFFFSTQALILFKLFQSFFFPPLLANLITEFSHPMKMDLVKNVPSKVNICTKFPYLSLISLSLFLLLLSWWKQVDEKKIAWGATFKRDLTIFFPQAFVYFRVFHENQKKLLSSSKIKSFSSHNIMFCSTSSLFHLEMFLIGVKSKVLLFNAITREKCSNKNAKASSSSLM